MRRPQHEIIDGNALRLQRLRYLALQINHQQALALSGVGKADLEIQAKDNAIRVSGRKNIAYPEGVSVRRRERLTGTFDRTLTVPMQINADGIKAEYSDGVLAVFIPRAEADKPRTIQIERAKI
jgi:HSP20 family protein